MHLPAAQRSQGLNLAANPTVRARTWLCEVDPPLMKLFEEKANILGEMRTSHSPLLWALETLAFSPAHVARVAVALAKLSIRDPGGRLSDRPAEALHALLHLHAPQGAITTANRTQVLDVTAAVPELATRLPVALTDFGTFGMVWPGPRFQDWPTPRTYSTRAELASAVEELSERVIANDQTDWNIATDLVTRVGPDRRDKLIERLSDRWDDLDDDTH